MSRESAPPALFAVGSAVALLCAASCAGPSPAAAEGDGRSGVEEMLSGALLASPEDGRLRREHALSVEIARTLSVLDGVSDARVQLHLADRSPLSGHEGGASSAAVVLVCDPGRGPADEDIRRIVGAAVPDLEPDAIEVVRTASGREAQPESIAVGPILVAPESAPLARALLGGLLVLCMGLAAGLVAAGLRSRRLRRGG